MPQWLQSGKCSQDVLIEAEKFYFVADKVKIIVKNPSSDIYIPAMH